MKDHQLGEQVLKETSVKDKSGNQKNIGDTARDSWGIPPLQVDARKDTHQPEKLAATETKSSPDALAEASKRLKVLNNELHKPGGPLSGSELELIGFDKSSRLLMIHRDQAGQVDGKFLVDQESGQIVGRTKPGQLDKWEKSPDYELKETAKRVESGSEKYKDPASIKDAAKFRPADWHLEGNNSATIWKDASGHIREIGRTNGDTITTGFDKNGKLSELTLSQPARDGKPAHVEQFKLDDKGEITSHLQGVREAWQKVNDAVKKVDLLPDGSLQLLLKDNERRTMAVDGSTVDSKLVNGQWLATQVVDAYNEKRQYKWNEQGSKLTEVTFVHADKKIETYRPGATVGGVEQEFWYRQPHSVTDTTPAIKMSVYSDGSLAQHMRSDDFVVTRPDGSIVQSSPKGERILRPPFSLEKKPAPPPAPDKGEQQMARPDSF